MLENQNIRPIDNPFVTTGYVGDEYFCDREKETEDLIRLLTNGNNVALISPRRIGKTDLLRHCFAQKEIVEKYYPFIIDIYSTKSVADFVNKLGAAILDQLKPLGRRTLERFLAVLSSVRSGISFDVNGIPTWSLSVGDISSPMTTLDEIFAYLQQADRPCLVAIDEFQQITKYADANIEATIRTYVQYCSNANFVFSGSRQHLMGTMFSSPARPFYQSVTMYSLKCLPIDKYRSFAVENFSRRGKSLDPMTVDLLYERFDGVPYYIQKVMNELYSRTPEGQTCPREAVDDAIYGIIDVSAPIYDDLLYQLPEKQSRVLQAIGKEGRARNVTSGKFAKKYGLISPSSVKSAVPALVEKGLLTREGDAYQVYDKFFNIWLNRYF